MKRNVTKQNEVKMKKENKKELRNGEIEQMKLELFRQKFIVSKPALMGRIDEVIKGLMNEMNSDETDKDYEAYLMAKVEFLEQFRNTVNQTYLFENLEDWWHYTFMWSSREIILFLCHVEDVEVEENEGKLSLGRCISDAELPLIKAKAPILTADEFAAARGVAASTIRVWIRRGKLRSAFKLGNSWMVPKLSKPIERGYSSARYKFEVPLNDRPAYFSTIKMTPPGEISFHQDRDNKKGYSALVISDTDLTVSEYKFTASEREKLETYLIASPIVEYVGDQEYYE